MDLKNKDHYYPIRH